VSARYRGFLNGYDSYEREGGRGERGKKAYLYSKISAACRTGYAKSPSLRSASDIDSTEEEVLVAS